MRVPQVPEDENALRRLAAQVRERPLTFKPRLLTAADAAYGDHYAAAAVVVWELASGGPIWEAARLASLPAPYRPGLFALREAPLVIPLLARVPFPQWVALLHGHGRAHPWGAGMASVVGVLLGRPSVGCAGTLLCGDGELPGPERGSWTPITLDGKRVGAWVRTRERVKPVAVSVGHAITLEEAVTLVVAASVYRLPEPLRAAHRLARETLQGATGIGGAGFHAS